MKRLVVYFVHRKLGEGASEGQRKYISIPMRKDFPEDTDPQDAIMIVKGEFGEKPEQPSPFQPGAHAAHQFADNFTWKIQEIFERPKEEVKTEAQEGMAGIA